MPKHHTIYLYTGVEAKLLTYITLAVGGSGWTSSCFILFTLGEGSGTNWIGGIELGFEMYSSHKEDEKQ
jgi:hypothetical protein